MRREDELALSEVLADPIVQALMAADHVDRESVEAMLRRIAARLPNDGFATSHGMEEVRTLRNPECSGTPPVLPSAR